MIESVTVRGADGSTVEFVDEIKASGGMKDIYFSPNRDYGVGFPGVKPTMPPRANGWR